MAIPTYRLSLDIYSSVFQGIITCRKGDTNRKIVISLREDSRHYTIPEGTTAVFKMKKPDGTFLYNSCSIVDDCIEYTFTLQTVAMEGMCEVEIQCVNASNTQITSPKFYMSVESCSISDSTIENTNEFTALVQALSGASNVDIDGRYDPEEDETVITITRRTGEKKTFHVTGQVAVDTDFSSTNVNGTYIYTLTINGTSYRWSVPNSQNFYSASNLYYYPPSDEAQPEAITIEEALNNILDKNNEQDQKIEDIETGRQDLDYVAKSQGVSNAGKYLAVGSNGFVALVEAPEGSGGGSTAHPLYTLSQSENGAGLRWFTLNKDGQAIGNPIYMPDITGKLDKNMGSTYSGKYLAVNSTGNIVPIDNPCNVMLVNVTINGTTVTCSKTYQQMYNLIQAYNDSAKTMVYLIHDTGDSTGHKIDFYSLEYCGTGSTSEQIRFCNLQGSTIKTITFNASGTIVYSASTLSGGTGYYSASNLYYYPASSDDTQPEAITIESALNSLFAKNASQDSKDNELDQKIDDIETGRVDLDYVKTYQGTSKYGKYLSVDNSGNTTFVDDPTNAANTKQYEARTTYVRPNRGDVVLTPDDFDTLSLSLNDSESYLEIAITDGYSIRFYANGTNDDTDDEDAWQCLEWTYSDGQYSILFDRSAFEEANDVTITSVTFGNVDSGTPYTLSKWYTLDELYKRVKSINSLAGYTKPSTGIPKTDLASSVQTSLSKADSALQSIPVATSTTIGGVKPASKTSAMTQEVGIDSEGKLYTVPGASSSGNCNVELVKVTINGTTVTCDKTYFDMYNLIKAYNDSAKTMVYLIHDTGDSTGHKIDFYSLEYCGTGSTSEQIRFCNLQGSTIKTITFNASGTIVYSASTLSGGTSPTVLTSKLVTGETTITLTDAAITDDCMVRVYTSKWGIMPTDVEQSGTAITLTFAVQSEDIAVKVEVV